MTESMVRRGHWLASPDALDLFGSLGPTLEGDGPTALAVLGADGSPGSTQLTRELAAVTSAETGEAVLHVKLTTGLDTTWSLCAVPDATAAPRPATTISLDREATVRDLRTVLSDARATLPPLPSETGGHALLRVPTGARETPDRMPTERLPAAAKGPFRTIFLELSHEDADLARYADGVIVVVPPDASVAEATDLERRVEDSGGSIVSVLIGAAPEQVDDPVERHASGETATGAASAMAPMRVAPGLGRSLTQLAALGLVYVVCMAGASRLLRPPLPTAAASATSPPDTTLTSRGLPLGSGALPPPLPRPRLRSFAPPPTDTTPRADTVVRAAGPPPLDASPAGIVSAPLVRATPGPGREPLRPVPASEDLAVTSRNVPEAGVNGVTRPVRLTDDSASPSYATVPGLGPVDATVLLSAVIRADGSVGDVELIEMTGTPADIVEPAIRSVKQWRYRPATRNGRDIDSRITVLIDFRDGA